MGYAFVDAHHHLQHISANSYPWLTEAAEHKPLAGDLSGLRRDYLVEDYRRDLGGVTLLKSVHVENGWDATDPVGETRWLQAQADRTGFPHAIVGHADLSDPRVEDLLAAHAAYPNMRGIRQILKWHVDPKRSFARRSDLADDADWRRGFALLGRFGMSFDVQIYPSQMPAIRRLADAFPSTILVVNHAGMPVDASREGRTLWRTGLTTLAGAPNVYIKLSGYGLYGDRDWQTEDVGALMLNIVDAFGAERCMCGSNLPVDSLYAAPEKIVGMFGWIATHFSPGEAQRLLSTNAETTYRI